MEEISLRDLIYIVLRGKWIIAGFTIFCVLITGIASFFFIAPVYEAQAMLMISPIENTSSEDTEGNRFFNLVGALSEYPQMTIDTYREQITAPVILDYIRKETNMTDKPLSAIASKITVNAVKNTNLITITVRDNNPETAREIANLISERFSSFVSETNRKQAEGSAEFIKAQQEEEKINLDKVLEELKNFLAQPRGPQELQMELDSKLQQLTEFKTQVTQLTIDKQTVAFSLDQGKKILSKTPETMVTSKSIIEDEFLSGIARDKTGAETSELANLRLSSEEINEIYVEAAKQVNELELELAALTEHLRNTQEQIIIRQNEIEVIQLELAEKQQKYDMLEHDVELSKQTYDAYQQKYKEAMIKQSAEIGKSSIIVVSEAITPKNPVAPNKLLNVGIALVLGLMISLFAVFLRAYIRSDVPVQQTTGI